MNDAKLLPISGTARNMLPVLKIFKKRDFRVFNTDPFPMIIIVVVSYLLLMKDFICYFMVSH